MTEDYKSVPTVRVSDILIKQEKILLVKHRKLDREYWVLPGGHLEYGETIAQCAQRELQEETSLICKFNRILFMSESIAPDLSRHIINIFVLVDFISGEIQANPAEHVIKEIKFFDIQEIKNLIIYPDIKNKILEESQKNWSSNNINNKYYIEYLNTPWG